jgi:ribosomal protein S18 acetylase RimI-like enzyme
VTVELVPSSSLGDAELTELFNAGYEGYVIPFALDEKTFRFMVDAFDIDLDASRVAVRDGERVGLANLALRGREAWIGGIGIAASARRQGLGEQLMNAVHEEARARGVATVWLEVIEQNEGAFKLYEKLGYVVTRDVEVWALPDAEGVPVAAEVPVAEAQERIRALRVEHEPWQRADGTIANLADAAAVATGSGAAIFRESNGRVGVLQIAGDEQALLESLRTRGPVNMLNAPAGGPAAAAFQALGGAMAVRQREMSLSL